MQTPSCPTLCDPMDCSQPGSSLHGIFQRRILKQVVISSSRWSSQPRDQTCVPCNSCLADRFFTSWVTGETPTIFPTSSNYFIWWNCACFLGPIYFFNLTFLQYPPLMHTDQYLVVNFPSFKLLSSLFFPHLWYLSCLVLYYHFGALAR